MKISELISHLEKIRANQGDMPVMNEDGYEISTVSTDSDEFEFVVLESE